MTLPLLEKRGATFSPCRTWRYRLWQEWDKRLPPLLFVMLNPSTADENANDPTVERCERRARAGGFGAVEVVNLFAIRATDPKVMLAAPDPVGPDNDGWILTAALQAEQRGGMVVCAWGKHGAHRNRAREVVAELVIHEVPLHVLALNKDGSPAHPLYQPYTAKPTRWTP